MIELHIYSILAILEILLLVSVLAGYLYVRNRRHTRTIARLSQSPPRPPAAPAAEPAPAPAPEDRAGTHAYSDFLREELEASSLMLGSGTVSEAAGEADPESESQQDQVREMLAARHQFLQLELDAQAIDADPEARRQHLVQQMQNLLATFTPAAAQAVESAEPDATTDTLAREQQLESQLAHLRTVVGNQQDVMRELRDLLEQEMGESEELRGIITRLQDAEARSLELERSLEAMDSRTPAPAEPGPGGAGPQGTHASPDSDMLRNLVGSQQQTISKLQHMLKQSVGEKEASVELRDAMEKIQRSNQELGTCVMVLEDENSLLREQLDALRSQLEDDPGNEAPQPETDFRTAPVSEPEPSSDPAGLDELQPDPQPEAVTAPEPEAELEPEPAEEEIEAASRAGETVEDIDALLEDPGASGPDMVTAVAGAEGEAEDARQEAAAQAIPLDSDTGVDAGESDDGINTLQDVGLDNDDEDVLSDEDIDALLAGEKKT